MTNAGRGTLSSAKKAVSKKIARTRSVSFCVFKLGLGGWHRGSYAFSTGAPMRSLLLSGLENGATVIDATPDEASPALPEPQVTANKSNKIKDL